MENNDITNGINVSLADLIKLRHINASLNTYSRKAINSIQVGQQSSQLRGRGVDFDEVRIYQAGDEIRNMDWRVTARTGKAHTKIYRQERERPVLLLVDFNSNMFFGTRTAFKSVIAAQAAAIIAWNALHQGNCVGGYIFSTEQHSAIMPKPNSHSVLRLLKTLSQFTQHENQMMNGPQIAQTSFNKALQWVQYKAKSGSLVFILSDFSHFNQDAETTLKCIAQRHEIKVGFIYDELEKQPPPPNRYPISNGDKIAILDSNNPLVRHEYLMHFSRRYGYISDILKKMGLPLLEFATHQTPRSVLLGI